MTVAAPRTGGGDERLICGVVKHHDDCTESCARDDGAGCNVGRKHLRVGGTCCITCYEVCHECGARIYTEYAITAERIDPEDGEPIEAYLCHCCAPASSGDGGAPTDDRPAEVRPPNEWDVEPSLYTVHVCEMCVRGDGGECHVPGCVFWMRPAPTGETLNALTEYVHAIPNPVRGPDRRVCRDGAVCETCRILRAFGLRYSDEQAAKQ